MCREKSLLVDTEIQTLLEKGAIKIIYPSQDKYLSSILLVEKKDSSQRPVINLKSLNQHILCEHFKMEGLHLLKKLLKEVDFLCKVDLKDAYFPLHKELHNFVCFEWKDKLYQIVCLCFGLAPVIRRLNLRIIIFLDNTLTITGSKGELLILRDALIFFLQNLSFVINSKKSVLDLCHVLEFLGLEIDSQNLRMELPKEKVEKIEKQCQSLISLEKVSMRNLAKLTGRLSSTAMAVLLAPLQYRSL